MVDERYMVEKPRRPGRAKTWLDLSAIPAMIDAAAALETGLERAAACTRRSPIAAIGAAAGFGWLLTRIGGRRGWLSSAGAGTAARSRGRRGSGRGRST